MDKPKHIIAKEVNGKVIVEWNENIEPDKMYYVDNDYYFHSNNYESALNKWHKNTKQAEVSDELEKIIRSFVYDNFMGRVHIKFQQGIDISEIWSRIEIVNCDKCIKLQGQKESPDCCHNYYKAKLKFAQ